MTEERRVLIVEARFYQDIADELAKGAQRDLEEAGLSHDRLGNECIGDGDDIHTTSCSYGISMPPLT